ncbi:protein FAM117B-like [Diorhabda sublineata]|uniref:protein FAM117B-like n=1 Tax=Diorhabda sublineata TaxID=1163346 RepID=UPI0024E18AE8|nr:protein FAM117B-like [Diorhabda sublineata]
MSGQNRLPKSSPNLVKQGPLKATIPISSVMKSTSNFMSGNSSTVSSTCYWKNRASPDQSSGQRSPGSVGYKGKSKSEPEEPTSSIRRTASLDTIYLQGQWPREGYYYSQMGTLQIDKAVQTDESDMLDSRIVACTSETDEKSGQKRPKIWNTKDLGQASPGENTINSSSQTLSSCILSPTFQPVNLPLPKSSIRSSVEGLNQEIERLVLKTDGEAHSSRSYDSGRFSESIPEGHRAPIADIFKYASRSRSVDTQTPQKFGNSSNSSSDSQGTSPDQETNKLGSSPQINRFLAREPPDGCEKVRSKSMNNTKIDPIEHVPQKSTFKLKPSLGSAFQILHPTKSENAEQDLPTVPSQESQSDE